MMPFACSDTLGPAVTGLARGTTSVGVRPPPRCGECASFGRGNLHYLLFCLYLYLGGAGFIFWSGGVQGAAQLPRPGAASTSGGALRSVEQEIRAGRGGVSCCRWATLELLVGAAFVGALSVIFILCRPALRSSAARGSLPRLARSHILLLALHVEIQIIVKRWSDSFRVFARNSPNVFPRALCST